MYRLITKDGDIWDYNTLEEAKFTQYIFGGKIEKIGDDEL